MSNKTQILCNKNNRTQIRLIKFIEAKIKVDLIDLSISEVEEKELFEKILKMRKENQQNIAIEIVKLGRVQKRLRNIKECISLNNEWKYECLSKLIIC